MITRMLITAAGKDRHQGSHPSWRHGIPVIYRQKLNPTGKRKRESSEGIIKIPFFGRVMKDVKCRTGKKNMVTLASAKVSSEIIGPYSPSVSSYYVFIDTESHPPVYPIIGHEEEKRRRRREKFCKRQSWKSYHVIWLFSIRRGSVCTVCTFLYTD